MEPLPESATPGWPFPFTPQDWEQTPPAVQAYLRTVRDALGQLQERVDTLEARLQQNSTTSHRPRRQTHPIRSRASAHPPPHPRKRAGNWAIRAIARHFSLPRRSRNCGPSGVHVATRRLS